MQTEVKASTCFSWLFLSRSSSPQLMSGSPSSQRLVPLLVHSCWNGFLFLLTECFLRGHHWTGGVSSSCVAFSSRSSSRWLHFVFPFQYFPILDSTQIWTQNLPDLRRHLCYSHLLKHQLDHIIIRLVRRACTHHCLFFSLVIKHIFISSAISL